MTTLLVQDPEFLSHRVPRGHPERPARLQAIEEALAATPFDDVQRCGAVKASDKQLLAVHPLSHVSDIRAATETGSLSAMDPDTWVSADSYDVACLAAGSACLAVDEVMSGAVANAFVASRPPGHHAEAERAMGFCLFNNAVIAARWAQSGHGAERVAVIDWDVHHGNGTQALVWDDPSIMYASVHQSPFYPGTGAAEETGVGNIVNAPLAAGDGSAEFRTVFATPVLSAVEAFAPDVVIVSAGFDAHRQDPLGGLNLDLEDFVWATQKVMDLADRHSGGRIVSLLEGGYDLDALADSVRAHVAALMAV